jgi:hypothetical protein
MANMQAPFDGPLPAGWSGGEATTKYWNGDYIHLYRVTRPCATCRGEISLSVSRKALQGFTKNAGLLLRNCPTCRAERKNGGPGSRGGTSRPTVQSTPAQAPIDTTELEQLRMYKATVAEELAGLYSRNSELFAEVQVLKARLAQYELPAAMRAIGCETVQNTMESNLTYPWQSS